MLARFARWRIMAERGGFEPPIQLLTVYLISNQAPSTSRPSLLIDEKPIGFSSMRRLRHSAMREGELLDKQKVPCRYNHDNS